MINTKNSNKFDKLNLTRQDLLGNKITYASMIDKKEYKIDWNQNACLIHRQVMAFFPNTYSFWNGKRIKILKTQTLDLINNDNYKNKILNEYYKNNLLPGTIIKCSNEFGLFIYTKQSPIIINEAQIEGKRPNSYQSLIQQMNAIEGKNFTTDN